MASSSKKPPISDDDFINDDDTGGLPLMAPSGSGKPDQKYRIDWLLKSGAPIFEGYMVPPGYQVHGSGVRRAGDEEGKVVELFSSPCLVVGIERDPDGDELVELAWYHYGQWRTRSVPRSLIKSGRKLVAKLGDAGFPGLDSSAKNMEVWLDKCEVANRPNFKVKIIARHLGWQSDGVFVAQDGEPYQIKPAVSGADIDAAVAAHTPCGSLEDWQDVVELVADQPIALMAVYASLASCLLKPLRLDSFVFDLCGVTTTGKTTCARLGMSVWADPRGAEANWNSTRVSLERRLSLAHGVPVVIDETSNAERIETIQDMLYAVPQNREKSRGNLDGVRKALTWLTVILTTGEKSIVDFTKAGGTAGRVLTAQGAPLGANGGELAIKLADGFEQFYGTAGPEFIKELTKILATDGEDRLRARHRELTAMFEEGGSLQRRRAPMVGALYLAAHIADEAGLLGDVEVPSVEEWQNIFSYEDPHDDRAGQAYEVIKNWTVSNQRLLMIDGGDEPNGGWAGKPLRSKKYGAGTVALNPEIVSKILRSAGFDLDAVKNAWAEKGLTYKDGKNLLAQVKVDGVRVRWFIFPGLLSGKAEESAAEESSGAVGAAGEWKTTTE